MSCTVRHPHDNCPDVTHKFQALESQLAEAKEDRNRYKSLAGKLAKAGMNVLMKYCPRGPTDEVWLEFKEALAAYDSEGDRK